MKICSGKSSSRRAFNLIELLVVIAIIAILASLLLPVLSSAKAQAYLVKCKSNQKQLAVVWTLYSEDNNQLLVFNGYGRHSNPNLPVNTNRYWVLGDEHTFPDTWTNRDYLTDPQNALFADYKLKDPAIYKCPADRTMISIGGQLFPRQRNYALNGFMGCEFSTSSVAYGFRRTSDFAILNPSQLFTFIDAAPAAVCWPAFATWMGTNGTYFFHRPTTKHSHSATVAFADGHVDSHRWTDPETFRLAKIARLSDSANQNPDDSVMAVDSPQDGGHQIVVNKNNADLKWLQDHATVRVQ